ncbi:hypothetical protein MICRO8M_70073 [Microbacterium sp. 8M]|nr:hypothetical protein MICRO8M_70073 [Microbacterium sp. 8M]
MSGVANVRRGMAVRANMAACAAN